MPSKDLLSQQLRVTVVWCAAEAIDLVPDSRFKRAAVASLLAPASPSSSLSSLCAVSSSPPSALARGAARSLDERPYARGGGGARPPRAAAAAPPAACECASECVAVGAPGGAPVAGEADGASGGGAALAACAAANDEEDGEVRHAADAAASCYSHNARDGVSRIVRTVASQLRTDARGALCLSFSLFR